MQQYLSPNSIYEQLYQIRDYIAGSVSGMVQILVGQPFDTIKVRLQSSTEANPSMMNCIRSLISEEGALALYKGTTAPLIGQSGICSIQFGINTASQNYFKKVNNSNELSIPQIILSGALGGTASTSLAIPIEQVRIRLQIQKGTGFGGPLSLASAIFKNYGISGLYKGTASTLLRDSFGFGIYFSVYEVLMRLFKRTKYNNDESKKKVAAGIFGGLAGFSYWFSIYPIDNIKSKIQCDSFERPQYRGVIDCFKQTVKEGGMIKGLYKGVLPCVMRSFPANAFGFIAYEQVKNALSNNLYNY